MLENREPNVFDDYRAVKALMDQPAGYNTVEPRRCEVLSRLQKIENIERRMVRLQQREIDRAMPGIQSKIDRQAAAAAPQKATNVIFENGGTNGEDEDPDARLLKEFRKAAKINKEAHDSSFSFRTRRIFSR